MPSYKFMFFKTCDFLHFAKIGIKMSLFQLKNSRVGFQMTLSKTKDIIAASPNPREQEMSNMISNIETKHGESKHGFGFVFSQTILLSFNISIFGVLPI